MDVCYDTYFMVMEVDTVMEAHVDTAVGTVTAETQVDSIEVLVEIRVIIDVDKLIVES